MTKIYGLVNDRSIMADVDEKHHTATISVYILDDLVAEVNRAGYWVDEKEGRWIYAACSECGTVHDTRTNFCPSCGARMIESEEG